MSNDSTFNANGTVTVGHWVVPLQFFEYPDLYCNTTVCPLELAQITGYIPNLGGNAFYLAIFALALVAQVFFGIRHRTWGFLFGMVGGLALEILGYLSRVKLHDNPFSSDWFKM